MFSGRVRYAVLLCWAVFIANAQTTKEYMMDHIVLTSGNYVPYPDQFPAQTKAPKGYKPFYISHYGRHGSRYHHTAKDYLNMYQIFAQADSANALTEKGKSVGQRFKQMYDLYYDRAGDLTKKGAQQHRGIAERMYQSFPMVFRKNAVIDVKSSTSVRCVMSMDAFCQQLKAMEPTLQINNESSKRLMYYLANDPMEDKNKRLAREEWEKPFGNLHYRLIHPSRMIHQLFSDMNYVNAHVDTIAFMRKFYEIKGSLLSDDSPINFDDVWTKEEMYNNWVVQNAWWYGAYGPCPMTLNRSRYFANDLLKHILDEADEAIKKGDVQANLRFGHDTALLPLTALLGLSGCNDHVTDLDTLLSYWNEYRIIPMAANIQFIFYRSKKNTDILVKVMLNEREVSLPLKSEQSPYYKWEEVKKYYRDLMNKNE
ncbi:MAG: histidine-type phosphatase [Bacteroidales bacterium]|nr:histidine-type phosphatase [Bacteroidales bacterium]